MPNKLEILKSDQEAAKAREVAEKERQSKVKEKEEHDRLLPIIEAKQKIEDKKRKAFENADPIVRKVLHDLGVVLGDDYLVKDVTTHDSYDELKHEYSTYNYTYAWALGEYRSYRDDSWEGTSTTSFDTDYSVGLVFSGGTPIALHCIRHSGKREKTFWGSYKEFVVKPMDCGFSEDELANTLYQLYTNPQWVPESK